MPAGPPVSVTLEVSYTLLPSGIAALLAMTPPPAALCNVVVTLVEHVAKLPSAKSDRVELTDWEGALSGSRQTVVLKQVLDSWAVIGTPN